VQAETRLEPIVVTSPFDGRTLGTVPAASTDDVRAAIGRADAAAEGWADLGVDARLRLLTAARGVLLARKDELARLVASEQGKPVMEALVAEIMSGLSALTYYIHETPKLLADAPRRHRLPFLADKHARLEVRPRGVTSVLSPWNYPFAIPFCEIAANLAAGNVVLLRPSTSTPLIALALIDIFHAAGVPRDVLQVITCRTREADPLVTDPRVRLLIFTGSTAVGRELMGRASKTLCRTVLELGGKDPFIVFADAPLERASRCAVWSAFMNAGQTCSSTERVYVHRSVIERFTERVVELTRALRVGDPLAPGTDVGPMTTADGVATVEAQVADALAHGAEVVIGGTRGEGRFFAPTVLRNVTHEMRVMRDETFGPLLPIMAFDSEDEAIRLANACDYGLTASVWTADRTLARRVTRRLESGTVTVNDANFTFAEAGAPWGGPKGSGIGRTHGPEGFAELVEVKFVSEDWSMRNRQLWWFPYEPARTRLFSTSFELLFSPSLTTRVASLVGLVPWMPLLAREADLPVILSRIPRMLTD